MGDVLFFGAGASHGSEGDRALVPPLGDKLFDALLEFEPKLWEQIPDEIAALFRADFEKGILALNAKMPHALPVIQRSMGAYFFRFAPTATSLYVKLAKRIKSTDWAGAIASLNYERMLLLGLARQGVASVCGESKEGKVEVCLPHGCCNLFCHSVRGGAGAVSMAGKAVSTNGPISCLDHPDAFWPRIRNDAFPPVMSYFEPSKFTTSGANFIEAQRKRLGEVIRNAERIAVVGIQVREQDPHIWDALASTAGAIYYCSGSRGAKSFTNWQGRTRSSKAATDMVSTGYWADDFDAVCAHIGIE